MDASSDGKNSDQLDEEDMGMTYAELGIFGKLRKISRCGPVKMYLKLLEIWKELTPSEIATKVSVFLSVCDVSFVFNCVSCCV